MFTIKTLDGHKRISTQDLWLKIKSAVDAGETEFSILANGQHDIGGPLWNSCGQELLFKVKNPGQRVGAMALPKTKIIVDGSAPADVGWLNSGGNITVLGDCGDTAGHCAAEGAIYIAGRAGTRTGSLMKKDPSASDPELWILKSTGSFSFEFMSGGIAVVCGVDCDCLESIVGERPCVGMVGGTVYVRGKIQDLAEDVQLLPLASTDEQFLAHGLPIFLKEISRLDLLAPLLDFKGWQKIIPNRTHHEPKRLSIHEFRKTRWIKNGLFSDVFPDFGEHLGLVGRGIYRLRVPEWNNHLYAAPCEHSCPAGIATQERYNMLRQGQFDSGISLVLEKNPFPASVCGSICPNFCMQACTRASIDEAIQIKSLGMLAKSSVLAKPQKSNGKSIAIIGAGVAGLTAAWRLIHLGHQVTVFDKEKVAGGKITKLLPDARLDKNLWAQEIARIAESGVQFQLGVNVSHETFKQIEKDFDGVILAIGRSQHQLPKISGAEKACLAEVFLNKINSGLISDMPKTVLVIGLDELGIEAISMALKLGAKRVLGLAKDKSRADPQRLKNLTLAGCEFHFPVVINKINTNSVESETGQIFQADLIILATSSRPNLDFLPTSFQSHQGYIKTDAKQYVARKIFAAGDCVGQGLAADAIAKANQAALACHSFLLNLPYEITPKVKIPKERLHTAWFAKVNSKDLPKAKDDYLRCVSCGTCRDCHLCETSCPEQAISRESSETSFKYVANPNLCIGCGICVGVCPAGIWNLVENCELSSMEEVERWGG